MDRLRIETLLSAVGSHLRAAGTEATIVVVGGAALSLRGLVARTTEDVDVIATWEDGRPREPRFPPILSDAIRRVARDFGLAADWLNDLSGMQWRSGLPPEFEDDLAWLSFEGLRVGVAGRRLLIVLKLFAAADQGLRSVHAQDLFALQPAADELGRAAAWVVTQDIAPEWPGIVKETVSHVLNRQTPRG